MTYVPVAGVDGAEVELGRGAMAELSTHDHAAAATHGHPRPCPCEILWNPNPVTIVSGRRCSKCDALGVTDYSGLCVQCIEWQRDPEGWAERIRPSGAWWTR